MDQNKLYLGLSNRIQDIWVSYFTNDKPLENEIPTFSDHLDLNNILLLYYAWEGGPIGHCNIDPEGSNLTCPN